MKRFVFVLSLMLVVSKPSYSQDFSLLPLMPYPQKLDQKLGKLKLAQPLNLHLSEIPTAYQTSISDIFNSVDIKVKTETINNSGQGLRVRLKQPVNDVVFPTKEADESYTLIVNEKGILIEANQIFGLLHAIQTVRQLYDKTSGTLPHVVIKDSPRFEWRGLLIDSVRHFIPIDVLKRQLAGMASAKLNVFHWHLTDDQGWRIPIDGYPNLHKKASDGLYYSHQEIRDLVDYAARLGIRVVPEVDFPGHASAIAVAYPQLMSGPSPLEIQRQWGVFTPLLDPSNPNVYKFVDAVFAQLNTLFPDHYVHIGGDEVKTEHWQQNKEIQAFMEENNLNTENDLHSYFNRRMQLLLRSYNKHMVGWDEILHPELDKDIVVQSWRGLHSLNKIVSGGYKGLLSNGYYIDQPQYATYHYRNDPEGKLAKPAPSAQNLDQHKHWNALVLSMPRLKGADVAIKIWLPEDRSLALVQFNDHPPRWARAVAQHKQQLQIHIDSWKGALTLSFKELQSDIWQAASMIGNTPYSLNTINRKNVALRQIKPLFPKEKQPETGQILGGEATIWSELVDGNNLDRRIWPRLYAIAERLWSPVDIDDPEGMYERLWKIDRLAQQSIGLKHQEQLKEALKGLQPESDIDTLLTVVEMLEPAHYYTRHHIHYQQNRYHQLSPLNNLVDYLPVESSKMQELEQLINNLGDANTFAQSKKAIEKQLRIYEKTINDLDKTAVGELKSLLPVLSTTVNNGLLALAKCTQHVTSETLFMRPITNQPPTEIIVALGLPIQKLTKICR